MSKARKGTSPPLDVSFSALLRSRSRLVAASILLIAINRAAGLVWPYLSKYLIDDVLTNRSQAVLLVLVGAGAVATLAQGITAYLITRTSNLSTLRLVAELRKRVHEHVSRLPVAYFDANKAGALVSRVMTDVEGVRNLLGGGFVAFTGAVLTALFALIVLVRTNALLTLIVFSILVPYGIFLKKRLCKYRPLYKEASVIRADLSGRLTESFSGIRVVKAYRGESQEQEVFATGNDSLLQKTMTSTRASAFLDLTVVVITGLVGSLVMYVGGISIMAGRMTVGDLFCFVMFLGLIIAPVIQSVSIGMLFNEAFGGLERVGELLAESREDHDESRTVRVKKIKGDVCFESVSFAYKDDLPVLLDVSFRVEPGTVTALVGPSGSGKSTITALIASFYRADRGTIRVDDIDLSRADLDSYRSHLGIVPQDTFLFSGTIRDNVAFARPQATEQEIIRACALAHVDEFTSRFEDSYDTVVGERGIRLSMGQRQRIAIARAILADPAILILDEATSSLDSVSEAAIQKALSFLLRNRTAFVIAHRLSTIRRADQILVIDGGQIVERGTHDTLLRARGKYWQLYTTQYELQSNLFLAPEEGEHLSTADPAERYPEVDLALNGD